MEIVSPFQLSPVFIPPKLLPSLASLDLPHPDSYAHWAKTPEMGTPSALATVWAAGVICATKLDCWLFSSPDCGLGSGFSYPSLAVMIFMGLDTFLDPVIIGYDGVGRFDTA